MTPRPGRRADAIALLAASLGVVAVFFRVPLATGFATLFGDRFDGRVATTLMEHWFAVLRGHERWSAPIFFHPHQDVLGYNDGYLLHGLIYAPARALGADPFLAAEIVNIVLKLVGVTGFYVFARAVMRQAVGPAALGAVLFGAAGASYLQAIHTQLLAVGFAPWLGLLLARAGRAQARGRRGAALGWGCGAVLLYGAWLLTGFYMAWFFTFYAGLGLLAWLGLSGRGAAAALRRLTRDRTVVLGWMVVAALAVVPFLALYLPKAAETGMHPYAEVLYFVPRPLDLIHVGPHNLVWGWLDHALNRWQRPGLPAEGEHATGFPLVLLLLAVLGGVAAFRAPAPPARAWQVLALTTPLILLLALRLGGNSGWTLLYQILPGARAVRVVVRLQLFLLWPVTLLALRGLAALGTGWRQAGWAVPPLAVPLLAVLLLAEQVVTAGPLNLDRPEELRRLRLVPPPPAGCRRFAVSRGRPPVPGLDPRIGISFSAQADAMLIAELRGLPTLNGVASFDPSRGALDRWDLPDFAARLSAYDPGGPGLCLLDLQANRWTLP